MTAPLNHQDDLGAHAEDLRLSDELAAALRTVVAARDRLELHDPQSDGYSAALTSYLQAAIHHLAVLAVAQAQQTEQLSGEVAALRARLEALQPLVH